MSAPIDAPPIGDLGLSTSRSTARRIDLTRRGRWLGYLALLLTIGAVVRFLVHDMHGLTFPYDLAAGEGLLLRDAAVLRSGGALYTPPDQFPYIVSVYPPGYTALAALVTLITGIHLTSVRLLSSGAVLISAGLITTIVYSLTRRSIAAIVAGFSTCGILFIYQWGIFGRVDTVAAMWSIAAIGLALLADRPTGSARYRTLAVLGSALCCVAALYTKQTALAAPAAIGLWLLIRRWQQAVVFVLTMLIVGGGLFLAINGSTGGEFFHQIVTDNVQPFSIRALGGYWRALALIDFPLLIGAVWYVVSAIRRRTIDLPLLYLIASGLLTVTVGRAGASISYLLEFLSVCCLVIGMLWGRSKITESSQARSIAIIAMPFLIIAQLIWSVAFQTTPLSRYYTPDPVFGYDPTPADLVGCQKLDSYVTQAADSILAEEASILVEHGKTPIGSGWLVTALAGVPPVDRGTAQITAQVRAHAYSLILLHWQSFPVDLLNTVAASYRQVDTVQCILTWKVYQP